jgi:hypothetical protein
LASDVLWLPLNVHEGWRWYLRHDDRLGWSFVKTRDDELERLPIAPSDMVPGIVDRRLAIEPAARIEPVPEPFLATLRKLEKEAVAAAARPITGSVVDCEICGSLHALQTVSDVAQPALPPSWTSLVIIARPNIAYSWWTVRACPFCGTHYEYKEECDSSNDPFETSTYSATLARLTPGRALALLDAAPAERDALARRLPSLLEQLQRDLPRARHHDLREYVRSALTEHHVRRGD